MSFLRPVSAFCLFAMAACGGGGGQPQERSLTTTQAAQPARSLQISTGTPIRAVDKRALVIGNSAYTGVAELPNPVNDAALIGRQLNRIGFKTQTRLDLAGANSLSLFESYLRSARSADIVMIYYAGHAIQLGGENYLVPVDFSGPIDPDGIFLNRLVKVDDVVALIENLGVRRAVIVLDACRNNPFEDTSGSAIANGLAPPSRVRFNDSEIFFLYSTAPGQVALDGQGANSPFAKSLSNWITSKDSTLGEVVRATIRDVSSQTGGVQIPWSSSNFSEPVRLNPKDKTVARGGSQRSRQLAGTGDVTLSPDIWNLVQKNISDSAKQSNWRQVEDIRYVSVSEEGDRASVLVCHQSSIHTCNEDALAEGTVGRCQRNGGTCGVYAAIRNGELVQIWRGNVSRPKGSITSGAVVRVSLNWQGVGRVLGEIDASTDGLGEMSLNMPAGGRCIGTYRFQPGGRSGLFNGTCTDGTNFSGDFQRQNSESFRATGVDSLGRAFEGDFQFAG
ncbi:MAG: caspase family protein [Pseudomonadota bacterium]